MKKTIRKKINYDSIANYYSLRKNDLPENLHNIININFKDKYVLDMACGIGNLTNNLYKFGANIIGIDSSSELLNKAKKYNNGKNIQYIKCLAEEIPFGNESFDIITVLSAWHWFNRKKVNEEVWRILKNNSYLIIMNIDCLKSNEDGIERETFNMLKRYCNICYARNGCNKKSVDNIFPNVWYKEWENKGFIIIKDEKYTYNIKFDNDNWKNYIKSSSYYSTLTLIDKQNFDRDLEILINKYKKQEKNFYIKHTFSITILKKCK